VREEGLRAQDGRAAAARQRHVRPPAPLLRREAHAHQRGIHVAAQLRERLAPRDARPERAQLVPGREMPDAMQRQVEAGRAHAHERVMRVLGVRLGDVADEAQRQVHALRRHPVRARHAAAEAGERVADILGKLEPDEKTDHPAPPCARGDERPAIRRARQGLRAAARGAKPDGEM